MHRGSGSKASLVSQLQDYPASKERISNKPIMQTVLFIEGQSRYLAWGMVTSKRTRVQRERERERGVGPIDRLTRRANRAIGWNFPFDLRYSAAADKRPKIQQVEVSSQSSGSETSLARPRVPMPLPYLTFASDEAERRTRIRKGPFAGKVYCIVLRIHIGSI